MNFPLIAQLIRSTAKVSATADLRICGQLDDSSMRCLPTRLEPKLAASSPRAIRGVELPMSLALRGESGAREFLNYRVRNSVGAYGRLQDTGIAFVMQQETQDTYAAIRKPLGTLKPETARSYDIGFEQSLLDGAFAFGATAFARKTRNQIDFDLVAFRYNNIALSRAKGVETFISLKPADNVSVSANYTYTDAEGRQVSALNYAPLLRRPKHSLSLSADWTAWEKAKLGATMRMVSDSRDGFGGFTRLDGFALVDLRAAVPLGDRLEIYGRVENLFDAQYQTVSGYSTYGRNAHIGVRASF